MTSEDQVDGPHGERLPWLQKIEGEHPRSGGGLGRLLGYAAGLALMLALVVGGVALFSGRSDVDLPGGDEVARFDGAAAPIDSPRDAQAAAPARRDQARRRPSSDRSGVHEAREPRGAKSGRHAAGAATKTVGPAASATKRARVQAPGRQRAAERAAERAPAAAPLRAAGTVVQIGAFSSRAGAERAWRRSDGSGRFAGARHWIEPALVRGERVFRLRVEAPSARLACGLAPRSARPRCDCFPVRGRGR
jgi:hypothetical protein